MVKSIVKIAVTTKKCVNHVLLAEVILIEESDDDNDSSD
jgi:hypothetical protein